jgi:hypothetical protein
MNISRLGVKYCILICIRLAVVTAVTVKNAVFLVVTLFISETARDFGLVVSCLA